MAASIGFLLLVVPSAPAVVLYDQTDSPGNNVTSQDFEAGNDPLDTTVADDFTVPPGESWTIDRVDVLGSYNVSSSAASSRVRVYEASGSLPGAAVFTSISFPADGGVSPNFALPVSGAPALPPGHYWVSVQAILNLAPGNHRWFWTGRTVQSGDPAAFQNPSGVIGANCTTFMAKVVDCGVGGSSPDQAFRLNGSVGTPDVPPPDGSPPPPDGSPPPDDGLPSSNFSFGKVNKNKKRGTAKLTVEVPAPGELDLAKTKKVKADQGAITPGGAFVSIKPRGKAKKKLNNEGEAKVKAIVTYTPTGGSPNTKDKKIELVKR